MAPEAHATEERNSAAKAALNQKYGKAPFVLGWHEIRLLLSQSLPAGVVNFDREVQF